MIRPVARRPGNVFDAAVQWDHLAQCLNQIYEGGPSKLSFEDLYRTVYSMVIHKGGAQLYASLKRLVAEHMEAWAADSIGAAFPAGPKRLSAAIFLKQVQATWTHFAVTTQLHQLIFIYMDQRYLYPASLPNVRDTCFAMFVARVIQCPTLPIEPTLVKTMLYLIHLDRLSDGPVDPNHAAAAAATAGMSSLSFPSGGNLLDKVLIPCLYQTSELFYGEEGDRLAARLSATAYLRNVQMRLAQEQQRCERFFKQCAKPMRAILYARLVTPHVDATIVTPATIVPMLENDKWDDLAMMYTLLLPVSAAHDAMPIHFDFGGFVLPAPTATTTEPAPARPSPPQPFRWVESLLELNARITHLLGRCFDNDHTFESVFHGCIVRDLNAMPRAAEFMSLYMDNHMKKGIKGKSEAEIDAIIDHCMTLFRYLQDRDIFERHYKSHLAKRLLNDRSVSEDTEKALLARLKMDGGSQFTRKMEGMFNDMHLSDDLDTAFRDPSAPHARDAHPDAAKIRVNVLTSTHWPDAPRCPDVTALMAPPLRHAMDAFHRFYMGQYSGRKLTFQFSLGLAELRAHFPKGRKEITVPTLTMHLLLACFNNDDDDASSHGGNKIIERTGLSEELVYRHLVPLVHGKHRLLLKRPASRTIEPTDSFVFNHQFTAPVTKINLLALPKRAGAGDGDGVGEDDGPTLDPMGAYEDAQEYAATVRHIEDERRAQIDCIVVRIMKARKVMLHTQLVNEVIAQCAKRFQANVAMIKTRIEDLITKEYLRRQEDNMRAYEYVA
ncbi:hypothetical protein CXG81DRAFT_9486 [Caulochytrium protostelioides]|uniref:Cullin family profile domain-containing protein n=1 Tax=Caulochytrium protostelioides TaxID=1555241 RepID=A0A4P9XDG1_9FUNG|nr:hypothetical protein CXG81DRAFT_9486 [Caulochytrium protostelioides]|eukprot:RKP03492.1 hypothetical protein CXG81DRAFT_9486 [Caulochytrium protostelioides]